MQVLVECWHSQMGTSCHTCSNPLRHAFAGRQAQGHSQAFFAFQPCNGAISHLPCTGTNVAWN
jgi:hypothetical protein